MQVYGFIYVICFNRTLIIVLPPCRPIFITGKARLRRKKTFQPLSWSARSLRTGLSLTKPSMTTTQSSLCTLIRWRSCSFSAVIPYWSRFFPFLRLYCLLYVLGFRWLLIQLNCASRWNPIISSSQIKDSSLCFLESRVIIDLSSLEEENYSILEKRDRLWLLLSNPSIFHVQYWTQVVL